MNITEEQLVTLTTSLIPYGIERLDYIGHRDGNKLELSKDFRLLLSIDQDICFYLVVSYNPDIIQIITFMGVLVYKGESLQEGFEKIKEALLANNQNNNSNNILLN